MQNQLLNYANVIKTAALELEAETKKPETDLAAEKKISKEFQVYSTFLRKFLASKGNDEILSKITPLIDNPRIRKPRNTILMSLEKGAEKRTVGDVAQFLMELRRIMMRYSSMVDRYPAVRLLKEILNFGVVNGVPAFKRLLSVDRRLYNTFNAQQEKKEVQEKQKAEPEAKE
ncbi:MAG: hypothetical protein PHF86_06755 [Candidatus Nanoarchaeia archaeon]|jgi:hypothetical protein|nr:hypothetical protein [Candidatus Nanoarchaeia archaeon]